ncbi:hypothetical protein DSM112329_03858 [Paraconexibacter sp. AEG42_29]|uniref:Uncharacterized protein n=1 Tax=Paraconexibacter sp. AEG42_29 TaxID=2997339 RepID=A0AAU7AZB3_9ACTN
MSASGLVVSSAIAGVIFLATGAGVGEAILGAIIVTAISAVIGGSIRLAIARSRGR